MAKKNASFIPIIAWRGLAETCAKYLAKGRLAAVSGRLQIRSYEAQDGSRRYATEIIAEEVQFLDYKGSQSQEQEQGETPGFRPVDFADEELPF